MTLPQGRGSANPNEPLMERRSSAPAVRTTSEAVLEATQIPEGTSSVPVSALQSANASIREVKNDETLHRAESIAGPQSVVSDSNAAQANTSAQLTAPTDPPVLLSKFTLYETKQNFYIVGSNSRETRFRVLVIGLGKNLTFSEPHNVLSRTQVMQLLDNLEKQAQSEGDTLTKRQTAWGILGCIRFTGVYHLCLVTKCSPVALLGGHYIFHIDETKLIPITHSSLAREPDRGSAEERLLGIFHTLELSKTFYFSPSYDITQTLQTNLMREKLHERNSRQEIYVWNTHLLQPVLERFEAASEWCLAIIHGFIDQAKISVFGSSVFVTLIARRSHYFAGARYLKRGINSDGHVANEVETEQIVSNHLISSFHDGRSGLFSSPRYTSYVQHRGSISLKWSQLTNSMSPKPPIHLDGADPYYSAAAIHFDNLMGRYGNVRVFNLVKQKERRPRESILGKEFERCIAYLNKFLPEERQIHYTDWDMSRASKGKPSEVIEYLETYAENTLGETSFFHNGATVETTKLQKAICRTNCIDCLDRTNAAQSVIAKKALGYQLHAIGIIDSPSVDYDTDVVDLLTEMWHDHGDTLALQYGGSNLVNTVEGYRRINQWSSHSRDLIESIRRFYNNSFMDAQRQDAINLFLGNFQYNEQKGVNLWDMSTDYYLHHDQASLQPQRSYRQWYTPWNLETNEQRIEDGSFFHEVDDGHLGPIPSFDLQFEHHWNRLYRPRLLTTLANLFVMRMNSTERYRNSKDQSLSPFELHNKKPDFRQSPEPEEDVHDSPHIKEQVTKELPEDTFVMSFYEKYSKLEPFDVDEQQYAHGFQADSEPDVDREQYEAKVHDHDDLIANYGLNSITSRANEFESLLTIY